MKKVRNIVILGSTGSIGESALKVIEAHSDRLRVFGLAAGSRLANLAKQAELTGCCRLCIADSGGVANLRGRVSRDSRIFSGEDGLIELVTAPEVDMVLCAIVGTVGLAPVLAAIRAGKDIALASKEVLVLAGELVMREARKAGVKILPVDSEHSALAQCLEGHAPASVKRLILTASGGAFRGLTTRELRRVTWQDAMAHPTWNMGPKVTMDSATLMNKALEMIEAHWLFGVPGERIDVLIHPQSVVHSLVEFTDGTYLAQMSPPDMVYPIQAALLSPDRLPVPAQSLNLAKFADLEFREPDEKRFPSLAFAREAMRCGGTMPAVMNAANEVAVERFRQARVSFSEIFEIIQRVMAEHRPVKRPALKTLLKADSWARNKAR